MKLFVSFFFFFRLVYSCNISGCAWCIFLHYEDKPCGRSCLASIDGAAIAFCVKVTSILVRNSLDSSDRVRLTEKKHSLKLLSVSYYTQWMHYENLHRFSVLLTHCLLVKIGSNSIILYCF